MIHAITNFSLGEIAGYRPGQLLYKEIDSTLRGQFAGELASMLASSEMAVVMPAFPDAGRRVCRPPFAMSRPTKTCGVLRSFGRYFIFSTHAG